mmetsp:Transcript_46365/g.131102  ORF Transcript_46365/g.131102 Transcript_46365/m.131102 type:complete len:718 (-) Transcript_46365:356-2509(-)
MKHLAVLSVHEDLELLVTAVPQRHCAGVDAVPGLFHLHRLAPVGPRAHDRVRLARGRLLVFFELAAAPGPKHYRLAVQLAPRLAVPRVDAGVQDRVPHDAREAERRETDEAAGVLVGDILRVEQEWLLAVAAPGVDVVVELGEVYVGDLHSPSLAEQRPEVRAHSSALHHEADVRLAGPQEQGDLGVGAAQRVLQHVDLHRVVQDEPLPHALDRVDIVRRDAGHLHGGHDELLLPRPARRGQGRGLAGVLYVRAGDDAVDDLALVLLVVFALDQRLYDAVRHALGLDVALRAGVERHAPPLRRQPPLRAPQGPDVPRDEHVRGAEERGVVRLVLVCLESDTLDRRVHGVQGRGAVAVDGVARALHAEAEGDAVRGDTAGAAGARAGVRRRQVDELARRRADVAPDEGPHQPLLGEAGLEEGLVGGLEDVALHGVHGSGLDDGDAEELLVEQLRAVDPAGVLAARLIPLPALLVLVVDVVVVPAEEGDLLPEVDAGAHAAPPRAGVVARGELARVAADRGLRPGEEVVVRQPLPLLGHVRVPLLALGADHGRLLQLLHPAGGPVEELLGARGHRDGLGRQAVARLLAEEAAQGVRRRRGGELVREGVRAEEDQRARLDPDLAGGGVLVPEGLQLQLPAVRAQEQDQHDPVLRQGGQPFLAPELCQRGDEVGRGVLPRAVQHAEAAPVEPDPHLLVHGVEPLAHHGEDVVYHPQARVPG